MNITEIALLVLVILLILWNCWLNSTLESNYSALNNKYDSLKLDLRWFQNRYHPGRLTSYCKFIYKGIEYTVEGRDSQTEALTCRGKGCIGLYIFYPKDLRSDPNYICTYYSNNH